MVFGAGAGVVLGAVAAVPAGFAGVALGWAPTFTG